jgi:NAD(P)-dependent dehydrogenase (short-subunit alcohol dehydrogenase family)
MPLPLPDSIRHPDLSGRVVFVTGATGGLGRALALAMAACGATVVLHARVVRKLEALYDEIVAAGGPQPTILPLDFTAAEAEAFGTTASAIASQLGRLDALVHTAVFLGSVAPIEHQALDKWQKAFAVNVGAAMALTRSCLPLLNAAPDASVVFTLDSRALDPRAYWGAYGATKAAVAALAATLADEWENRPNLRVNAVIPGAIRTPLRTRTHPGEDRFALPPPESLVPLYLHLVAGQSKSESGVCIDGPSWLAGQPAATPLVSGSGSPGSRP